VPDVLPIAAGIVLPDDKVKFGPPAVAETVAAPPQVVPAFGAVAIVIPVGKVSMSGAVKVATLVFGLESVMVRVDTPPVLMVSGLKLLPSVGLEADGTLHVEAVITLLSIVTPPLRAKALPDRIVPVVSVID